MADTPLRAPSGTEGLRDHDEEKPPVQPPSEESHVNVKVVPLLAIELFLHSLQPDNAIYNANCAAMPNVCPFPPTNNFSMSRPKLALYG